MDRYLTTSPASRRERHPFDHQPADEVNVAAKSVKFRDDHRGFELACLGQRSRELGPAIQRVVALAGLDLGVSGSNIKAVPGAECLDGGLLGFQTEPGLTLLTRGDADIGDCRRHLGDRRNV